MRRSKLNELPRSETISRFELGHESLQESFFKELGVNVIWVEEFDEIPNIIKRIKAHCESF